jgi:hypothetical protein
VADTAVHQTTDKKQFQPSKLFASLFRNMDKGRRLTVLDVGAASPGTVDFFSQFKCRVHFRDFYSEPLVRDHELVGNEQDMGAQFRELIDFPDGTKFDICLFWDFLNYLNAPALRAFSAVLRPYIRHGTLGHGFGVHTADTRLKNQRFSLAGSSGFHVSDRRDAQPSYFARPQAELYDLLGYLDIDRGVLLPDGKVEILLRTTF